MKKSRLLSTLCATVISLCVAVPAEAFLMTRLDGDAAYDSVLDITWTTDAGFSGLIYGSGWGWVRDLNTSNYLGFHDWRLASISVSAGLPFGQTTSSVNCSSASQAECEDNELGYMYYYNLASILGPDKSGTHMVGDVTLTDIQSGYWSSTGYSYISGPVNEATSYRSVSWVFLFDQGIQIEVEPEGGFKFYTWVVRDGDVVPEPPIVLLFATGLVGLIWASRMKSAK